MSFPVRANNPVKDSTGAAWYAVGSNRREYKTAAFRAQISIALGVAVWDGPKPFVAFDKTTKQQERL
jgi:hypothetical protein